MPGQGQIIRQVEEQRQTMSLTPQQYLTVKLVELPITDLENRVRDELYENVALEEGHDDADDTAPDDLATETTDLADEGGTADDEGADNGELPDDYNDDDDLPTYTTRTGNTDGEAEIPIGDTRSFIEDLQAQIAEYDVDDKQRELIDYLIGSLDDRGFIDRPLRSISDDLLFNHNIEASEEELEQALHTLQQFEPCGIGARDLRECLLLQIDRQIDELPDESQIQGDGEIQTRLRRKSELLRLERRIIADHFNLFERNEPERLAATLGISPEQLRTAIAAIGKLNPHPGRSLHEAADDRVQTVTPDFIVETDHESTISFSLNMGEVPPLHVSRDYLNQLKAYQKADKKLSHSQREAYVYTKQKVESAQMFIQAIRQRQQTLTDTMKAIIALQRDFILTQDESQLHPMRLADVQLRTGLHISTISRVVNSKYVLLDGTLYSLKYFFLRTKQNAEGQEIVKTKIYPLLSEIVENEDKRNPLSDERISEMMKERGEAISRRTVAKYRAELKIPPASLRKRL